MEQVTLTRQAVNRTLRQLPGDQADAIMACLTMTGNRVVGVSQEKLHRSKRANLGPALVSLHGVKKLGARELEKVLENEFGAA